MPPPVLEFSQNYPAGEPTIGVEFWFQLGGSYLVTFLGRVAGPGKFLKLGALKLHCQDSEVAYKSDPLTR